jgi:uncharacterized protein YndB with AHSA1/START domain
MSKYKFICEYEVHAAISMLYPYISTPKGLEEWFAEKVILSDQKIYNIYWDNQNHPAKIISQRANKSIRYQFFNEKDNKQAGDLAFLEFKLEHNEFTQTSFIKITDYSDMDNEDDLYDLWDGLIGNLKEKVGDRT